MTWLHILPNGWDNYDRLNIDFDFNQSKSKNKKWSNTWPSLRYLDDIWWIIIRQTAYPTLNQQTPPHLPLTTEIHRFFALQATKLMPLLNDRQARMGPWNLAARCLVWDTSKLEVLVVLGKHATKWPFFYKSLFALEKLETHTQNFGEDIKTSNMHKPISGRL